jgi:hypothetical protein
MRRFLIAITILILGGLAIFFYLKNKNPNGTGSTTGIGSFFPTGENTTPFSTSDGLLPDGTTAPIGETEVNTSRFKQLSSRPVAGFTLFTRESKITTTDENNKPSTETVVEHVLRYASRSSGFIYEIKDQGVPLQITNIYIPNVYEAFFADNNSTAILRFLREDSKTIATYSVPIPEPNPDGTRTQKEGMYFPDNILNLAISPSKSQIIRLAVESGLATISTSSSTNTGKKIIFQSPLKEWLIQWPNTNSIFIQTKAAGTIEGFLYSVEQNNRLKRTVGNVPGLTTSISPSGRYILYSQTTNNNFSLRLFDTKTNIAKDFGLPILPEKCVWLKNEDAICAGNSSVAAAVYPDSWYAGLSAFSDNLYRITISTPSQKQIYGDTNFDMTNLQINEDKGLLYFIDKKTGLLWQFTL